MLKNPIYFLVIPVTLLGIWFMFNYGIYSFIFLYGIFGVYFLIFFISYYLKEKKHPKRLLIEWVLIGLYIAYIISRIY